ncbi:hypothetical protein Psch_02193 [Pelotomaculum schinkii]|uniref:Uncharacterized protein n=1 Tax=Pelotomaculum schinkii TaxID=78350 RepID=A0A4Y7RJY0_9FIRM|nr:MULTISPECIES: hypothetical protein [Pelotomaculum]TEB08627.1 hypothetical protein Psch_02193 [Pelotomaculum schinkii]TEB16822.1 hypothetical protein Psfp_00984 [Pelotomaculum sp. FP]
MRPDSPKEEEFLPLQTTSWYHSKYTLKENNGIVYLVAEGGTKPEPYQPLEAQPPKKNNRNSQPYYPEEWNCLPHINLARLDLNNQNDILDFVNRWGLLGLWEVKDYRYWSFWPYERFIMIHKDNPVVKTFSYHYINPDFMDGRSRSHHQRYREPLDAFIKAAQEYQNCITLLEGDADDKSDAQDLLNKYISDCHPTAWYITEPKEQWTSHWQSPSLLHTCYLIRWMDLISLRDYKRCKHKTCRKIFIAERPNERYCSFRCKENSKRLRNYHK